MKSKNLLLNIVLLIVLMLSIFLASPPPGRAQTDREWSEPVNLSLSGIASNPVVVIDLADVIHAIWVDEVDGYKYSQSADGVNWSPAQTIQFPFEARDQQPFLLADENGSIHVFWMSVDRTLFYGQATPSTFTKPGDWKVISRLGNSIIAFDVILDARGVLHIAYVQTGATGESPAGIYYRRSGIGGGSWLNEIKLYETEYFRSADLDDVYVRVSTSNSLPDQGVYVTWDNRSQKRVFMAVSEDSGTTWGDARQIKGPEDTGGIDTPFNLTVSASRENVLLVWQVGEPGASKCTVYSQWSRDAGATWDDTVPVLGGRSECPVATNIIARDGDYTSVLFEGRVTPILVAWNGAEWSAIQSQTQLPSFVNPLTFDAVLLGCRFDLLHKGRLYVAGCDQGRGGDVWFLSRALSPVDEWFSASFIWGEPELLTIRSEKPERITNFHTAHDLAGNIHAVWAQSPVTPGDASGLTIEYARWNGVRWTAPESVISSVGGMPLQVSVDVDSLDRLLLSWVDGYNGDLVFSWANLERANLASEWEDASGLPAASRLITESDMIVDGSGRIINVAAISINENRGIYMTQSTNGGQDWSDPVLVFNAVTEGWERIERPRLSLGADGALHLVFVRGTVRDGQPVGLYYSHSLDGGATWSAAQILSEGEVHWLDVVSYGASTVHVVWQEFDGLVFANVSQVSNDGGLTWGKQHSVTGVTDLPTQVSLASDGRGLLHFVQLVGNVNNDTLSQKGLVLQDWKWDGLNWTPELTKDIVVKGQGITYSLAADLTSSGLLGVFIPVEYTDSNGKVKSEVLTLKRNLENGGNQEPVKVAVIPTSVEEASGGETVVIQPTSTPDFSILYDDNVSTNPLQQNVTGLVVVGLGVIATVFLILWRRPARKGQ